MAVILVVAALAAVGWWVWEKSHRKTHPVPPGLQAGTEDRGQLADMFGDLQMGHRPPAAQLLSTISWIAENDYPARGELAVDA